MKNSRIESDSMGSVTVPAHAYYGAQTQRAVENFPISGWRMKSLLIQAFGLVKYACATANHKLGLLTGLERAPLNDKQVRALLRACREVAKGRHSDQFPVDVFQTGSGTSTNINVNEVIANRAIELSGGDRLSADKPIHPLDHVNMSQSSNDIFPTATHVAVGRAIDNDLIPALRCLADSLNEKANAWDDVIKIGRTHLMDATPLRLGQELSGYARQAILSSERARYAIDAVLELPVGGTAVGTGMNSHSQFGKLVARTLADETNLEFVEAENHFEANAARDGLVASHGILRIIATTLFHVANNIRWLASGPRCGFNEISLPSLQPGSSIMPGKVNPVICESVMQVAARILGNDQTIAFCGASGGQFQLNVMMPLMAHAALESIELLSAATRAFDTLCVSEMEANEASCQEFVERSISLATGLTPLIGYDRAAALAKEALHTGMTVRELCIEKELLPADALREALDFRRMTSPRP